MSRGSGARALALALLVAAAVPAALAGPAGATPTAPRYPVPADGRLAFGVHLDGAVDSPAAWTARTGTAAAQYGVFAAYPLTAAGRAQLEAQVAQVRAARAGLFLTLEPAAGLAGLTRADARALAQQLAAWNATGVPVLVRFAHEMNGSWYPWGQQPAGYQAAFRTVASAVHALAPGSAMVWAPTYAGGYPYAGGAWSAQPGSAAFAALDTDRDGRLTMADDPYRPYYPGDTAVDWVGLTLYHWGDRWPWGANDVPEPGKLLAQVTGTYRGLAGDERALPDFYGTWSARHHKPFVLAETAALFTVDPPVAGAGEEQVKGAWLAQVLDPALAGRLPQLKMVNWFEQRKTEAETGSTVDWRVATSPALTARLATGLAARGPATGP